MVGAGPPLLRLSSCHIRMLSRSLSAAFRQRQVSPTSSTLDLPVITPVQATSFLPAEPANCSSRYRGTRLLALPPEGVTG